MGRWIFLARRALALTVMLVNLQVSNSIAQDQFQYRQQITKENGLPGDVVEVISQDEQGFIWIGTRSGLVRYDGSEFLVYKNQIDDSTSLVQNWIRDIEPIGNKLWIGTSGGISVLDLNTDKFNNYYLDQQGRKTPYTSDLTSGASLVYHDRMSTTWIAGGENSAYGWCRYLPGADDFECHSFDPAALPGFVLSPAKVNNVLSILRDNEVDNILWVGTNVGLIKYNIDNETLQHFYYEYPEKRFQLNVNAFRRMWQAPDRKIYCGSWSGGLNIFDPRTEEYYPAPFDNTDMPDVFFQSIREISAKSETEIWVTLFKSLIAYDFIEHRITMRLESSFASDEIYGADFVDKDGRIWSRLHGLHIFDPRLQQFQYTSYAPLNQNGEGFTFSVLDDTIRNRITVISRDCDGLYHYYPDQNKWTKTPFPHFLNAIKRFEGNNAVPLSNNELIISAFHGIYKFFPEEDRIVQIDQDFPVHLKAYDEIFKDNHDQFWIGTANDGVIQWNPKTGKASIHLDKIEGDSIRRGTKVLFIDNDNNVWINRKSELFLFKSDTHEFVNISKINPLISGISEIDDDGRERLWLTKTDQNIILINPADPPGTIDTTFSLGNRNSQLISLHNDQLGNMWGFYLNKLTKINLSNYEITTFNSEYLSDYNQIVSSQIVHGHNLVLGLPNGLVTIDLSKLEPNVEQPIPYISAFGILDKGIKSGLAARNVSSLNLKRTENFFSIEFSALGYTLGKQNTFRYRLADFQKDWIDAKGRRFADYTNVPSGDYVFQLQVFNSEGQLSSNELAIPVVIQKHWTELWVMRLLFIALFAGLIYGVYMYRIRQIKKKEQQKTSFQMQLADVKMTALRAQMNPHFIFNCLNSIENFVIKNDTLRASTYLNDFARLMRLILQNSRSQYVPLVDEIEALELYLQMESLRFTNKFTYELFIDNNVDQSGIEIPPMLIQPYVENAIWHGLMHKKTPGRLDIRLSRSYGTLQCIIQDNGIGRVKSQEINAARKVNKKKSMGMSITQDRINILNELYHMNTEINIEDLNDPQGNSMGTRIELNIPI